MGLKSGFLFTCGALLAVAAVFAIAGSSTALNNPQAINMSEYSGELSVSGTGYVYVEPNMARVTVGVINEAETSTKAMADNADTMDGIMKAVRGLGISDRDIKTSTISVQPKYEYQYPDSSSSRPPGPVKTKISGYTATNTVTVTVRNLDKVGPVIDAAYGAGANEIHGVSFMLTEDRQAEVYREALEQAVAEAKSKAKTIAGAAGIEGIKLKSISESGAYFPVYESYAAGAADRAMAAPTPVSPGEQRVSATVSLKYVYVPQ
jgi:hypothetical protein